jgi:(2R)-ethylmalonyl-CoA mutase
VVARLTALGLGELPVVVGGIIPPEDAAKLAEAGVARVYTPKDYDLNAIMADIVEVVDRSCREAA